MTKTSETIIFFGSGPVAASSLELLSKDFSIEAIITKPSKNSRDKVPVIDFAKKAKIDAFTPENKSELDEFFDNAKFTSQVGVLIDYGIIVSQKVIDYFPKGIVNSHFSLLPEWRGADPITFAILSGQKYTGVSLMLINPAMDEGLLLSQKKLEIDKDWSEPELTRNLVKLSHKLLDKDLPLYITGKLKPYEQDNSIKPTYSRKLTKDDGIIDWQKPADQIEREIKAYLKWPKSHTAINGKEVIITKAHITDGSGNPGSVKIENRKIVVYCSDKALTIDKLKPIGKNEMDAQAFISGYLS